MDVGIRELKQRLSEIIELVAQGETVRVTDRGVPKAVLSPALSTDQLAVGIEEGWIRPPRRQGQVGRGPRMKSDRRVADVIAEDREDRI
ncbi:MAG: type II toxin-antitoxin system Phd/YefM family antitoxin [Actinomycetota bacterium]